MVKLAVIQMKMVEASQVNEEKAFKFLEQAVDGGAHVVLLPELFSHLYFPQQQRESFFSKAVEYDQWPFLKQLQEFAKKHKVVLPVSFFERAGQAYFNSLCMVDAGGEILGLYRKSHIPDGPGYTEKYYFSPGDTGFKVFNTKYGNIGCGICWDQWFPEAARVMVLRGADLLLYPTAIGSEPEEAGSLDTAKMWERAMIGHSVCNAVFLAAANRVGIEDRCDFYGRSFISDYRGELLSKEESTDERVLFSELDFAKQKQFRAGMGFFRDRRPDLYDAILTLDGKK